ncbi:MAG: hypothetical protein U0989_15375 [Azonexus sp.]|nr:hypothetical protein [Azonexus sp.]MDZ4316134.1 hypothetical protein [Azonexus sp.]
MSPPLNISVEGIFSGSAKLEMGTLLRALLLSLVVHFIFLLGFRWVTPDMNGLVLRGVPVNVRIVSASAPQLSLPVNQLNKVDDQRIAAPLSKQVAENPGSRNLSNYGNFSRSTAATDLPVKGESHRLPAKGRRENISVAPLVDDEDVTNSRESGEYRLSLAREARRFKRARHFSGNPALTGVVILGIRMSFGSTTPVVSVNQSSGLDVLDTNALEMMERAVRLAAVPETLRGKQFAIHVPIHYKHDDD